MSDWALGAMALVAFKPSGDVACAGLTLEAAWPVQGRGARQSERLGSWRCGPQCAKGFGELNRLA